jgi:cyclophilin family peptidyl-prolyl cis-trans isomerase
MNPFALGGWLTPLAIAPLVVLLIAGRPVAAQPLPEKLPLGTAGPDSFLVRFETTKGSLTMKARRAWSPRGVDRLYHLAKAAFYDGAVVYRVGGTKSYPGGMVVQFGLTDDSLVNRAWLETGIPDEPVRVRHRRGTVMFARDSANTRTVELAIDLSPNSGLDTVHYQGVVGFPTLGEVIEGMTVLDALERRWGNAPIEQMDSIIAGGRRYLDRKYPGLDRIRRVSVPAEWPSGRL